MATTPTETCRTGSGADPARPRPGGDARKIGGPGAGRQRREVEAGGAGRRLRRRSGRAGRQLARIRQARRCDRRDGPEGNPRGGGPVEPLPRPPGQGDGPGIGRRRRPGRSCAAPSRTSIPASKASLLAPRKLFGIIPFGNKHAQLFRQLQILADPHRRHPEAPRRRGKDELLMDNAAIDTERANLWTAMGRLEQMIHHVEGDGREAGGQGQRTRRNRPGQGQGDPRERAVLCPPAHAGSADPDGGDGAGLSGARSGQEEQCRAGEGRRPRLHHHRRRRCARR